MKKIVQTAILLLAAMYCPAQNKFPNPAKEEQISILARQLLSYNSSFRLQILAGKYNDAIATIDSLRKVEKQNTLFIQFELYAQSKMKNDDFKHILSTALGKLDNQSATYISTAFLTRNGIGELESAFQRSWKGKDSLTISEAIDLCNNYLLFKLYKEIESPARLVLHEDDKRRYIIDDSVLVRTSDGAMISCLVVRKRNITAPQSTALFYTIYTDTERNLYEAKLSAANGFVGVVGNTRGKALSSGPVIPYEKDGPDVTAVIDWISKQSWSDGKVGMYGGSYSGYAQWAAAKYLHPALKTIVPYVAAINGLGLPMENNIFLNANYGWAFYVTNNKYLDNQTYFDPVRWRNLNQKWYASGVAYRKIDSVDGTPNPWLQKWLQHPSFDSYWQKMIPWQQDYSKIKIPVLTITGYYDDGQISALYYLKEHYKYNKAAEHYLIIGPYDHTGAQIGGRPVVNEYKVDPVALIDTRAITYQWLHYVLHNGPKPGIVKDKVNYQVMGANKWEHASSLEKAKTRDLILYLSDTSLSKTKPIKPGFRQQEVDLADRTTMNNDYYPWPVIRNELNRNNGLFFISEPLTESLSVNGCLEGTLKISINKKDVDLGVVLYEVTPEGKYFHLSYYIGRASYANDITKRKLLTPGKIETIHFDRTRMVSRQLSIGSRLMVVVNVNKNSFAQINYGTGKDVSDETIHDAKNALQVKWYNDSYLKVPVK